MKRTHLFGVLLAAAGGICLLAGFESALQAVDCDAEAVEDAYCAPAHREAAPNLGPGPRCESIPLTGGGYRCQQESGSVCSGLHWDNAVPGRCPANGPGQTGDCADENSVTNVRIFLFAADCRWSSDWQCGCFPTYLTNSITGEYIFDDKEVCNCADIENDG